jgi:putative MATE family efflux protein
MPPRSQPTVLEMSLWTLAWPLFVELLLTMMLGVEDSFYLARISDQAAAGVGALLPIFGIFIMVFQAFSQAGASVASQLIGGGRPRRVDATFMATILMLGGLGALVSVGLFVIHRRVGVWLGLSAEIYPISTEYLRLVLPVMLVHALRFAYGGVLVARGRTRFNMWVAVAVNLANLFLDHIFTMGTWGLPRLGVTGIAYSTIAAQSLGLLLLATIVHLRLGLPLQVGEVLRDFRSYTRPILDIGVPSAIEPVSYQLNQLVMVGIVVSISDVALATRTYTLNIILFAVVLVFSIGLATQVKIAHQVGARLFDEADRQLRRSLRLGLLLGFSGMVLINLGARHILGLFTSDPEILRLGQILFLMGFVLEPSRTSNIVAGGSLRGSGDARFVAVASVLLTWSIAVPLAYLFALRLGMGLPGVWLAMICDELSRGLMNYWRWRTGAWKTKGVLAQEPALEAAG